LVVAVACFPIHDQSEPIIERQGLRDGLDELFFKRSRHPGQLECLEGGQSVLVQHGDPFYGWSIELLWLG